MRSQEFTAKTTQEAIDEGLATLGVTIADVRVDVIQEGAKGLFGLFGSRPARVRITVMEDENEDDQGLSDLLGSFSLSGEQTRKKSAPKAQKPAAPKAEKAEKPAAPKSEKAAAPKAEKAEKPAAPKAEKPAAPKSEKAAAPKAEKAEKPAAPKAEKAAAPKAEKAAAPKAEKPAAPKAEKQAAPKSEKAEETAEKPAKPKKPRAPKRPRETKEQEAAPREYAPMAPAQAFTPTEPPVMHDEATPAGRAQRFLLDVTERMNVKVDVYVDDSKEDSLYIHMIGDTLGILIGRRGETLDALQYLTSLQVNKGREGYIRVTLDTENYRAKREDSLRRLAQRMANRAQKTGRKVVLEPMNPYERRVLHTALQNHPAVTTHSEGEEPNRRVVITLNGQSERGEKGERAERGEKTERSEKSGSSRRSRSRRRGRRGPKGENAAVQNAAENAVQETTETSAAVDVLSE